MPRTKNFTDAIRKKLQANADLADAVNRERFSANVGQEVYAMRVAAGLSQAELADRIGTHQSVIARLENADYDSHSLSMLNRIATALGKRVEVKFVDRVESDDRSAWPQSMREISTNVSSFDLTSMIPARGGISLLSLTHRAPRELVFSGEHSLGDMRGLGQFLLEHTAESETR